MRVNILVVTVFLATAMAATAAVYAQPAKIGGTGVGLNNPANTGSNTATNPGAGANASINNDQAESAPVTRDPGSGVSVTVPLGVPAPLPAVDAPSTDAERRR